jgi:hypothetical protein
LQADLEPAVVAVAAAVVAAHKFSQCNVVWRSFLWARGSGCQSFGSHWCFISSKCGSSISTRFWSHSAHAVCFCTLVTILEKPDMYLYTSKFVGCKGNASYEEEDVGLLKL